MAKYLNQMDAVFLRMDGARTPMHAGCLLTFKLPKDAPADFMHQLVDGMRNAPVSPPYSYRLANSRLAKIAPAWVDAHDLDPDYHVRHSALPHPGGERELGELIARLHSHPMDLDRPLWELHVIEGLENGRFAIYLKAHHACSDGATGMRNFKAWLSTDPKDRDYSRPFSHPAPEKSAGEGRSRKRRSNPLRAVAKQLNASRELIAAMRDMNNRETHPEGGMYSAMETPPSPFNSPVTAQRRLATQLYDFARFRALADATGASINDIALTVSGGAMRRYLQENNALPDKSLIASVPVALQSNDPTRGNAVAGFVVPLATEIDGPLERLKRIQAVTRRTKEELQALSPEALDQFAAIGFLPMVLGQATGLNAKMPPLTNITVSNVPGPRETRYLCGAELEAIYPVSLLFEGYSINLTLVSYADKYCLGYIGCRDALPHLQHLAVYTGEALSELEAAVG